jgi:hypothetical protein
MIFSVNLERNLLEYGTRINPMEIKDSYRFLLITVYTSVLKMLKKKIYFWVIIKYPEQDLFIKHVSFPSNDQNPTYTNMML